MILPGHGPLVQPQQPTMTPICKSSSNDEPIVVEMLALLLHERILLHERRSCRGDSLRPRPSWRERSPDVGGEAR